MFPLFSSLQKPRSIAGIALIYFVLGAALPSAAQATGWLSTHGNHIYDSAGNLWHGIGVNLLDPQDNRSCVDYSNYPSAPTSSSAFDPNNAIARMDKAVSWGANTIRLMLVYRPTVS